MKIYNTLSREKEEFISILPNRVGMYVCGPTVYGDPHLGHARPSITFDVLFRYLQHKGYAVRYVRNITDVGHLENDADDGNDKIAQKARLEKLEPMEIAQHYTNRYNDAMRQLNVLPPSIEPRASGHIIEQIELIKTIIAKGFAYESKGSIYFDVETYHKQFPYGQLSGRVLEDQQAANRALDGQSEKRKSYDFALWKNAKPEHIMRWSSPWSEGFPGWHLECSAMSAKYLGAQFDIHGGGMDLMFPHHECEIAQSTAAQGKPSVNYWMHNNMITIDGQKMGKSLHNFIILEDLFAGKHPKLEQAYSPMCIRFFILQAHYRGTLDFSNAALQASEKGLQRLLNACELLPSIQPSQQSTVLVSELIANCYAALDDDLNTPIAIAHLFDAVRMINNLHEGREQITATDLASLVELFQNVVFDILGLQSDKEAKGNKSLTDGLIQFILNLRLQAKSKKDFGTSDAIRDEMNRLGVVVKDTKDGFEFTY